MSKKFGHSNFASRWLRCGSDVFAPEADVDERPPHLPIVMYPMHMAISGNRKQPRGEKQRFHVKDILELFTPTVQRKHACSELAALRLGMC